MATLPPCFEWPPDVEAAIYDRIRPHVQCGLKRRTWHAVHVELRKTVPRHEGRQIWLIPSLPASVDMRNDMMIARYRLERLFLLYDTFQ
jgi:hypothetical protein